MQCKQILLHSWIKAESFLKLVYCDFKFRACCSHDDHSDHMEKKKLSVQAGSSDQWGSIYQWWTMLILVDEKFEGEIVMLGPSWHGTCQLWKGGINSLYTCYLSNLKRSRILKNVVQWERKQFTHFEIMKNLQMQSLCITRPNMLKYQGNLRIWFKAA